MKSTTKQSLKIITLLERRPEASDLESMLVEHPDLEVRKAVSGAEFLEFVRAGGNDAVLCGMHLEEEKGKGLRLLGEVRKRDQLLPFFFYTCEDSPQLIAASFQSGGHDYFVAEDSPEQLEQIIEAMRVSVELAKLLRAQQRGSIRSAFEEKYAGLFEELEEGSLMISADSGVISYANESLASGLGYAAEELVNKSLDDLLDAGGENGEAESGWRRMLEQVESGVSAIEATICHKDGSRRTFWTQARLLELAGATVMLCQCRDITRFEQLEREVISVRNQLRTIVENSADAIIVARDGGAIEFIGGAAPQLFGVSADDKSLRSLANLFAGSQEEVERLFSSLGSRMRVASVESSIVSRWGTRVPVSVAITVLPSSDGVTRYLFNILDITAQKVVEAEKMLTAELIRIASAGAGPVEALPKLVERVRKTVPLDFALVVHAEAERDVLCVAALYRETGGGSLRVGQILGVENLPAEEELWLREGIIRNDLQERGLHPLEDLLYREGVRSYVSVPLKEKERLIGGAHFGSARAYVLNRGHLTLFRELASALSSALVRAQQSGNAQRYRLFSAALAEAVGEPLLLCDPEGMVLEANEEACRVLGADAELRGRQIGAVLRSRFPSTIASADWLRKRGGGMRPHSDRDGQRWQIAIGLVGPESLPTGYTIRLQKA